MFDQSTQFASANYALGGPPSVSALLAEGFAPVGTDGQTTVIASSSVPSPDLFERVQRWFPEQGISFVYMDHVELQDHILRSYSDEVADLMSNGFARTHPEMTAKTGFAGWQAWSGVVVAVLALVLIVLAPALLSAILASILLMVGVINVVVSLASLFPAPKSAARAASEIEMALTNRDDTTLPFYTVVIPVYQEESVIGELVHRLASMDYPSDRLEILFLIEQHDPGTRAAALAVGLQPHMRIVDLPPGKPQTKPRACNLGLMLARGDLLVIYDAEDRPERDQLRRAAATFAAASDDKLACVQAKLLFYNAKQNLLTRQFAMEYSVRFDMIKPGLSRLGMPIPLGGTSNHFRTDLLREIGGWDAWNVTEDADLGMRCRARGYRVETMDSVTWEEATSTPWAWIRQRTRWFKGHMMTVLVHTRRPVRSLRQFGLSGMITLLGIVAGDPLMYLSQPVALVLSVLAIAGVGWSTFDSALNGAIFSALLVATGLWIVVTTAAAVRRKFSFAFMATALPGYWALNWVAAWRALVQLSRSPFVWEKTPHGGYSDRHVELPLKRG